MSAQDPVDRDGTPGHDETFLSRWSRRKARSRAAEPAPVEQALVEPAVQALKGLL